MESLRSWKASASDYAANNPKTMRNIMIGCGIAVAIIIAVIIYKRSSEGFTTTPLYNVAAANPVYNDIGVIGPNSDGGDMYASLGYANEGSVRAIADNSYGNYAQ